MSVKLISVWVIGAILLFAGVWIINNLELTLGVSAASYAVGTAVAIVLILIAGLCWISVAVGTKKNLI